MPANLFLAAGALFGASGVVLGAFGAHALASRFSESNQAAWDTAVTYQLTHALALLVVGLLARDPGAGGTALNIAGWGFVVGVALFSGSLYLLAFDGPRFLGPVTPLGGAAFIVGWVALLVGVLR
ncbi:MAG: DUF423 domain-containing protein [Gammaproteobacteria bacterium]|nr:DUF423 domain-containing protein [Gammaproteobacteria bacterium]